MLEDAFQDHNQNEYNQGAQSPVFMCVSTRMNKNYQVSLMALMQEMEETLVVETLAMEAILVVETFESRSMVFP